MEGQKIQITNSKTWPTSVVIYTDGASRGNPGAASVGILIEDAKGNPVFEYGETLGIQTNNYAEYTAVLKALKFAKDNNVLEVTLRSDSQLLIRQLIGQYKVKSETLKPIYIQCLEQAEGFSKVHFEHVRREFNKRADELANLALDKF